MRGREALGLSERLLYTVLLRTARELKFERPSTVPDNPADGKIPAIDQHVIVFTCIQRTP